MWFGTRLGKVCFLDQGWLDGCLVHGLLDYGWVFGLRYCTKLAQLTGWFQWLWAYSLKQGSLVVLVDSAIWNRVVLWTKGFAQGWFVDCVVWGLLDYGFGTRLGFWPCGLRHGWLLDQGCWPGWQVGLVDYIVWGIINFLDPENRNWCMIGFLAQGLRKCCLVGLIDPVVWNRLISWQWSSKLVGLWDSVKCTVSGFVTKLAVWSCWLCSFGF